MSKILSLGVDNSLQASGELIEYPQELRGTRNLSPNFESWDLFASTGVSQGGVEPSTDGSVTFKAPSNGYGVASPFIPVKIGDVFNFWSLVEKEDEPKLSPYENSFVRQVFAYDADKNLLLRPVLGTLSNDLGGTYGAFVNEFYPSLMQYGDGVNKEGSISFSVEDFEVSFIRIKVGAYRGGGVVEKPITLRLVKLEKGSKALPWTPPPEDLGLDYPDWVQNFTPSFHENGVLCEEFVEGEPISIGKQIKAQKITEGAKLNG